MAETSTIFGFMKYVSAVDILSDFKKTVDSHFVNSLKKAVEFILYRFLLIIERFKRIILKAPIVSIQISVTCGLLPEIKD